MIQTNVLKVWEKVINVCTFRKKKVYIYVLLICSQSWKISIGFTETNNFKIRHINKKIYLKDDFFFYFFFFILFYFLSPYLWKHIFFL